MTRTHKGIPTEENLFTLFQKPKMFSGPTKYRPYYAFLDEIRLFMVAQNTLPSLWTSTFKAYLEGEAKEAL